MPKIKKTVMEWREWLIENAPKDVDTVHESFDKIGKAWMEMLGSLIDWHLQLEADAARLERARVGFTREKFVALVQRSCALNGRGMLDELTLNAIGCAIEELLNPKELARRR